MAETHDRFESAAKFRLQRLPFFVHAYLEEAQPYTGQNLGRYDPLWLVQYLDNRDKHKVISIATSIVQGQVISGRGLLPAQPTMRTGWFEHGAILARVPFVPPADMSVNLYPPFEIVFDESPLPAIPYLNVLHTLNRIIHRVERIAARFDEMLNRHYGMPLSKRTKRK